MNTIVSVQRTLNTAASLPATAIKPGLLTPLLDTTVEALIDAHPQRLLDLVAEQGSPLNLVWPHAVLANVSALKTVLTNNAVRHELFYGAKANKSPALINAAGHAQIGVDVSSIYEFQDALKAGINAAQVCATGPAKTRAFHQALVHSGALISVDSVEEFAHLEALIRGAPAGRKARLLLRYRPASCPASRFGMDASDLQLCLGHIADAGALMGFEGFHFHLGGYGYQDRAQALGELIPHVDAARSLGLRPRMIDIGGGLPVRYIEPQRYAAFLEQHNRPAHYQNRRVPESFYPYGGPLSAGDWLQRFLDTDCQPGLCVAAYLKREQLVLGLEPGRSLVDQAAITLFRITRVKKLADQQAVIFVEGSSFSACETWFGSEFLSDPILISRTPSPSTPLSAYLAGHSCLDDDVISRRLINFAVTPLPGDLLVYANTAGYQMDLLENQFHRHPLPRRLIASCPAPAHFEFVADR